MYRRLVRSDRGDLQKPRREHHAALASAKADRAYLAELLDMLLQHLEPAALRAECRLRRPSTSDAMQQ
jgi:hypothetical protein